MKKVFSVLLSLLLCFISIFSVGALQTDAAGSFFLSGFLETLLEKDPSDVAQTYRDYERAVQAYEQSTGVTQPDPVIEVETLLFATPQTVTLYPGERFSLSVTILPENATDKTVTFQSSDDAVAQVTPDGVVIAGAAGQAQITVQSANGKTAACTVSVVTQATGVSFKSSAYTFGIGERATMATVVTPAGAYKGDLQFTSSDPTVAAIDQKGVLTALKTGTSVITVQTHSGKKDTCAITVKNAPSALKLNYTSKTLYIGEQIDLNSSVNSGAGACIRRFSSSNPSVATVDSAGVVTVKKRGSVTITCKTYNGLTATCTITSRIVKYSQAYTSAQVYKDLQYLEQNFPDLIDVSSIGRSVKGKDIPLLTLGTGSKKALITAGIHAREHLTISFTMACIENYAAAYYTSSGYYFDYNMRKLLQDYTLYIVPVMNPDGLDIVTAYEGVLYSYPALSSERMEFKSNANGVNLNRNFPFYWGSITNGRIGTRTTIDQKYKGPSAASEPETKAVMNLCAKQNFRWMFSMHLRGNCIYWNDVANGDVPGDYILANKLAANCGYYLIGRSYDVNDYGGGFENWFRYQYNRPGLCIELVPASTPSPTDNSYYNRNFMTATNWEQTRFTFIQGMLT